MEQAIRQLVNFEGWNDVKELILDEVKSDKKKINTNQAPEIIALQYTARIEAEKIVKKALSKIDRIGMELQDKKISYK